MREEANNAVQQWRKDASKFFAQAVQAKNSPDFALRDILA
jgi:hypothetical protein